MTNGELTALMLPLHTESRQLAQAIFANDQYPDHPCTYLVREAYAHPDGRPLPAGWPANWEQIWHLPEPFNGNVLGRPEIAFVGLNPSIDSKEPCPTYAWSVEQWLEYYLRRLNGAQEGHFYDGTTLSRLYKWYQKMLNWTTRVADQRLGEGAILAEIIPYKALSPNGALHEPGGDQHILQVAQHCSARMMNLLRGAGAQVVVTAGSDATCQVADLLEIALPSSLMRDIHGQIFRAGNLKVIPSYHPTGHFGFSNALALQISQAIDRALTEED